jgi:hypothetical protein
MLLSSIKSLHGLPLELLKSITVFSTLRSLIEQQIYFTEDNLRNECEKDKERITFVGGRLRSSVSVIS